ncbi:MAG TPA: ABC transporter permease [Gemmatimonadota bacterium]|nr:ABC transporter permease [Gemmatimonadota bacterium]
MLRYTGRRLLEAVPLLLGIVTLTFLLLHLAPGDPTTAYFNPNIPPDVIEQMRRNLGLDRPLPIQYVDWLRSSFTGHFGYSFSQHRPVAAVIGDALPNTLLMSGISLVLIFVLGCAVGVVQAVRQYSPLDQALTVGALTLYSVPGFWLGLMLILLVSTPAVSSWLHLPISGMTSIDYEFLGTWGKILDRARHLVLPVIALGLASAAGVARYTRGAMLEVIRQDYIRTARAKGLSERQVILRHALRNALLPVVSLLGLYLPLLFGGTVVIEVVFSWPGMGRLLYDSILARDYPVVMAATFLFGALVVAGNLVSDLLYAVVDPRVRYGEGR